MLIKVYGEFWRPDFVEWGRPGIRGKLKGRITVKRKDVLVDNWSQSGIYILYQDREPVYVGQASENNLGMRLRNHLTDRLAGRWNAFSWYGVRAFDQQSRELTAAGGQVLSPHDVLDEIEAIFISATEPRLNKHGGKLGTDIRRFDQYIPEVIPLGERTYQRVQQVEERITKIEELLLKPKEPTSPTKKPGRPKKAEQESTVLIEQGHESG